MIKSVLHISLMVLALVGLASCDDKNDDFTPGDPTREGSMRVYFDASNPSDFIDEPDARTSIEVAVSRVDTTAVAEVPIICQSAAEGLTVPQSVAFAAGQKTAYLTITFGQLAVSERYSFSLAIPDDYADHYTRLDGSAVYASYVMAATWETYVEDAQMYYTTSGTDNSWYVDIERLGTTNRYAIRGFLGSGVDMIFTVGDAAAGQAGYYKISPYTNYVDYVDEGVTAFYFYDAAKGVYPEWEVGEKTVEELCILSTYGTTDYSYIAFDKGYGQFGTYWSTYADGSYDYYNYVKLYFDPVE